MRAKRVGNTAAMVILVLGLLLGAPMATLAAPPISGSTDGGLVGAPPDAGAPTTVNAPLGLRLREGPNLTDRILLSLRDKETVYPYGSPVWSQGISWTFCRVYRWGMTYEGFCASAYLGNYGGYVSQGDSGLKVTAGALRLRSGAGLAYGIQLIVPYGTVLQDSGATQWADGIQWTRVKLNGSTYWAASSYLTAV